MILHGRHAEKAGVLEAAEQDGLLGRSGSDNFRARQAGVAGLRLTMVSIAPA